MRKESDLRILSWNCNGALRKKTEQVDSFGADIISIQECEDPETSNDDHYKEWAGENFYWVGENKNKGLGIFGSANYQLQKLKWNSPNLRYFIPCRVNDAFNFVALWCHLDKIGNQDYIGQFWKYMKLHKSKFKEIFLAGDFNSNVFWDKKNRRWNHSNVVHDLSKLEIESLYHKYFLEEQGSEKTPTFYLTKKIEKPYHLDYIFASYKYSNGLKKVTIGNTKNWMKYSDHMPVFCEIKLD